MRIATLLAWLLTAGIGGYMLRTWIARGGLRRQRATGIGAPPLVIFGHAGVAVTGLTIWACFLATSWNPLAWLDVALISGAITLGICMVTMWTPYPIRDPHTQHEPTPASASANAGANAGTETTEQAFTVTDEMIATLLSEPFPAHRRPRLRLLPLIPVCHGFAALVTFMLATLTAAGAGFQ
jgi:hypothetical protein